MNTIDKFVYSAPKLESYSEFGVFVAGASGDEPLACGTAGDDTTTE